MNDNTEKQRNSVTKVKNELRLDPALVKVIMQTQSLPEDVVIEFLKIQGSFSVDNVRKEN
jgi:hypothetical protein